MVSSAIERAKYGPSVAEIFFGAVLSLLLGAVVAVVYLVVQPVQVGKAAAKGESASVVTYTKGTQDGNRGKQWLRKKQLFTEKSSVEVNEDELNAWITAGTATEAPKAAPAKKPEQAVPGKKPDQAAAAKKPDQAAPGKKPDDAPPAPPQGLIVLGTPNFHIAKGVFQVGCEAEVNLDIVGLKASLIMQTTGRFAKTAEGIAFVPDELYIGCCPLHKLPGVARFVFGHVFANEKIPEDITAAWKKLADVSVQGDSLKLTMP
jgi:hypothetical protein